MPTQRNKLRTPLKEDEFYCVACNRRCKSSKEDMCVTKFRNGSYALYGYCKPCDCDTYKIIKDSAVSSLTKKYGKC
jgi:hypothetical protein